MTLIRQHFQKAFPESPNQVPYFQFPSLSGQDRLKHGVFTRLGGVSESPYDSLNISYSTGDRAERVDMNLRTVKEALGITNLLFMNQVHGKDILLLRDDTPSLLGPVADADAIVTDIPFIGLMVKQADCQGVILFDRVKGVVSIVHCGWRGNVHNILGSVVEKMKSEFGCTASDIIAVIGPSLGPCCAEFIIYEELFPEWFRRFMVHKNHFDLWEISRKQLLRAGLDEDKIEVANICTKCNIDLFYSYRAERITGRFATIAMLC